MPRCSSFAVKEYVRCNGKTPFVLVYCEGGIWFLGAMALANREEAVGATKNLEKTPKALPVFANGGAGRFTLVEGWLFYSYRLVGFIRIVMGDKNDRKADC